MTPFLYTDFFFKLTRMLVLGIATIWALSGPVEANYWGERNEFLPKEDFEFNTRNRVLLYVDDSAPYGRFSNAARAFQVRFVGLNGISPRYRLMDHYQGETRFDERGSNWYFIKPRYADPLSAGCNSDFGTCTSGTNHVDLLNIEIPAELGPIVGVILDGPGEAFDINRIVADGRSFSFTSAQGAMYTRYATHFALGRKSGKYQTDYKQGMNIAAEKARKAYGDGQSVIASQNSGKLSQKTLTIRVGFGGLDYATGRTEEAPEVDLTLISDTGETFKTKLAGPLVYDQRWAKIRVPLGFTLSRLEMKHTGGPDGVVVEEIGFLIEEELTPETLFQGRGRLRAGGPTLTFQRHLFPFDALTDDTRVQALLDRSAAAVFEPLARTSSERAAIQLFRSSTTVLGHLSFDEWFLSNNQDSVSPEDLLRAADPRFAGDTAVAKAWNGRIRSVLKKAMDDRTLALRFVDRMNDLADRLDRIASDELGAAKDFLDLETDLTVQTKTAPSEPDVFNNAMTGTLTALTVVQSVATVPQVVEVVKALGIGLKGAQTVVNLTRNKETPTTTADIGGDKTRNQQTLAFGDATLNFGIDYDRTKRGVEKLRGAAVRDVGLLEQMARFEALHLRHLSKPGGGMTSSFDDAFRTEAAKIVRAKILRTFLPIRGVLVGHPLSGVEIPAFGYALSLDQEVRIGYGSGYIQYQQRNQFNTASPSDVLAYSAYIVQTEGYDGRLGLADYSVPQLRAHKWQLAIGTLPRTPLIVADQQRADDQTLWDYVTDALRPIDVFNLLAYSPERLIIHDPVYACDKGDRNDGWQCFAEGEARYKAVPPLFQYAVGNGIRTMVVTGNPDDFETVSGRFDLDSENRYTFRMHQVLDDTDIEPDDASSGTLVPTKWVVMFNE